MTGHHGFTLIELLATLAIVALLLALSTPGFMGTLQRQRLRTGVDSFLHTLQFARMQALHSRHRVCVVRRDASWREGWTVFEDLNANCVQDVGETSLVERDALPAGIRATGTANAPPYISYLPNGQSVQLSGAFQATSIYFCPETPGIEAYRVVISRGGRTRLERLAAGSDACSS